MRILNFEDSSRSRIRSIVWDFFKTHKWQDIDDFSLSLSDSLYDILLQSTLSKENLLLALAKTRTSFFRMNKISKREFVDSLLLDIGVHLATTVASSLARVPLTSGDIFPRMSSIDDDYARKRIGLLQFAENALQTILRGVLRRIGASPIPHRERDSAQEVADIELCRIRLRGRFFRFAVVVKGSKSVHGKTLTWRDVAHQVVRAYQRGKPDYVILATAKEPADGLITSLEEYGQNVNRPGLVVFIPPLDLAKILLAYERQRFELHP